MSLSVVFVICLMAHAVASFPFRSSMGMPSALGMPYDYGLWYDTPYGYNNNNNRMLFDNSQNMVSNVYGGGNPWYYDDFRDYSANQNVRNQGSYNYYDIHPTQEYHMGDICSYSPCDNYWNVLNSYKRGNDWPWCFLNRGDCFNNRGQCCNNRDDNLRFTTTVLGNSGSDLIGSTTLIVPPAQVVPVLNAKVFDMFRRDGPKGPGGALIDARIGGGGGGGGALLDAHIGKGLLGPKPLVDAKLFPLPPNPANLISLKALRK